VFGSDAGVTVGLLPIDIGEARCECDGYLTVTRESRMRGDAPHSRGGECRLLVDGG
jgi:hypothetical protein